jgi:hypothetical protein
MDVFRIKEVENFWANRSRTRICLAGGQKITLFSLMMAMIR